MTLIEAKIILNKRKECDARMKKYRDRCGRCTPCPLRNSLDDYITARKVVEKFEMERRQEYASL